MKNKLILIIFSLFLIAVANAQNVGIGTTTPKASFNVAAEKNVVFGTDTTAAENKLMWLPAKGAFRVGYYNGSTNDTVGMHSTAVGQSIASGDYSTAMGGGIARGPQSTAMGSGTAIGEFSTAMGNTSSASGNASTAMGYSVASGDYSTTMGYASVANVGNETVIGTYNDQSNPNALFEIGNGGAGALHNAFTVLDNGDVYIGVTNPSQPARLVVQGNEAENINYAFYAFNGASVFDGTSPDANAPVSIWASDRIAASEFDATSDMRIKRNIKPLPGNSLGTLAKINVVFYAKFSRGGISKEIGVIGQELEKVLPQAVKQGAGEIYNDNTQKWEAVQDFRTVNYQTIGMLTTKAVQELNQKVDEQQATIEEQKAQINSLSERLKALEAKMK
jgi:hypothetical protein